jgi:hypothetical protein
MYASKLLTERSPVAKCVMIAEADMDAAERIARKVKEGNAKVYDAISQQEEPTALPTEVRGLVLWRDGALWTVSPCNCENADLTEKKMIIIKANY